MTNPFDRKRADNLRRVQDKSAEIALEKERIAREKYEYELKSLRGRLGEKPNQAFSILVLRLGLCGEKPRTLVEVGAKLALTRDRVRVIEQATLLELERQFGLDAEEIKKRLAEAYPKDWAS